ncbi:hypothetical protein, partial [Orbus sasakiae]|uniref:hypothetical protein n=1 Tax=Orbus sasakiae TaxID=1078475 RepID=UPI0031E5F0A6
MKKSLIQTGTTWLNDNLSQNAYILNLTDLPSSISVLSVQGDEQLDKPWRYEVTFTSLDKHIRVSSVLTQPASFSFKPHSVSDMLRHISSLDTPAMPRT